MTDYDPKSALAAVKRLTNKRQAPDAYDIRPRPATLCFPLMAFVENSPHLPDDFHNVPRSSDGLKNYERPDGGVFLGLFELPRDPSSTIVVFGDPLMELNEAKQASYEFRRRLQRHIDDGRVADPSEAFAGKPSLRLE